MGILISYIAVSLIICILYGMIIFSLTVIKKTGLNIKGNYLFQIWSGIVILAILYFDSGKIELFGNVNLHEWFIISALMLIAIVPTSLLIYRDKEYVDKQGFELKDFLSGASMEIPQRLLAQNLFFILGVKYLIGGHFPLAIILNGVIWVQFIIIQEIINRNKISKRLIKEMMASLWFSLLVGYIYYRFGNIMLAMLTHGCERYAVYRLVKRSALKKEMKK